MISWLSSHLSHNIWHPVKNGGAQVSTLLRQSQLGAVFVSQREDNHIYYHFLKNCARCLIDILVTYNEKISPE